MYGAGGGDWSADDVSTADRPNMREGIEASWHGAIGMLAMPVARPFAVLACVLGIIGLILCIIVVVAIYIVAGALAIGGAGTFVVSFWFVTSDPAVMMFCAGIGMMGIALGIVIGALNYLLGRTIFKGIANLSGHIRHRRVKIKKEFFQQNYGAVESYPYGAGGGGGGNNPAGTFGNEGSEK
jgi:hypothetical protein